MSDADIRRILTENTVIAVLGAHDDAARPSHYVPAYLHKNGYRIVPVNPRKAGMQLWGETVVASLDDIDEPIDLVDVFRPGPALPGHLDEFLRLDPTVVWFQLGITNDEVAEQLRAAGIEVVQNRCTLAEHRRLF